MESNVPSDADSIGGGKALGNDCRCRMVPCRKEKSQVELERERERLEGPSSIKVAAVPCTSARSAASRAEKV